MPVKELEVDWEDPTDRKDELRVTMYVTVQGEEVKRIYKEWKDATDRADDQITDYVLKELAKEA